ncbi:unnamed protein product [Sympodiomycopsis kandeliae]
MNPGSSPIPSSPSRLPVSDEQQRGVYSPSAFQSALIGSNQPSSSRYPPSAVPYQTPDRYRLQPGPRTPNSSARRREQFKRPPTFTPTSNQSHHSNTPDILSNASPDDMSARLYRQRFRQRCQAAMTREKKRSSAIARLRGGHHDGVFGGGGDSSDEDTRSSPFNSSDLSSSEMEGTMGSDEEDEDAELFRRVMLAEYKSILRSQEYSGQCELGWMNADEVAWLEDELQREQQEGVEYYDEEDELYQQYQHAQQQQQQQQQESEFDEQTAFGDVDDDVFRHLDVDGQAAAARDVKMDMS